MNYTTYHKLQKPLSTEKYNIGVHNTNADIIDSALNRLELKNETQDADITNEIERATERENEIITSFDSEIKKAADSVEELKADLGSLEADITVEAERAVQAENLINEILTANKPKWDDKYTRNEVDNKFSALETNIDWKESVETFDDIGAAYPEPQDGWTVNVKDTDYTYRYNGTDWVVISANAIPKATNSVDGLLSKEDHARYEDTDSKKHTHVNKAVLDGITSDSVAAWNTVTSKNGQANKVWKTDDNGNPAWREENEANNTVSKSGDTMTGYLNINTPSGSSGFYATNAKTGNSLFAGVGDSGKHGIHSKTFNKWIAYMDDEGNAHLDGTADKAISDADGNNLATTYLKKNGLTTFNVQGPANTWFPVYLLMFDITTWYNSTTVNQPQQSFTGRMIATRENGYMQQYTADIALGVSYQKSETSEGTLTLKTSNSFALPCVLCDTKNEKYYLALKLRGETSKYFFVGRLVGTYVNTWIKSTDSSGALPDGYEIVYDSYKYTDLAANNVPGKVKPDGTTTTVDADGTIHAVGVGDSLRIIYADATLNYNSSKWSVVATTINSKSPNDYTPLNGDIVVINFTNQIDIENNAHLCTVKLGKTTKDLINIALSDNNQQNAYVNLWKKQSLILKVEEFVGVLWFTPLNSQLYNSSSNFKADTSDFRTLNMKGANELWNETLHPVESGEFTNETVTLALDAGYTYLLVTVEYTGSTGAIYGYRACMIAVPPMDVNKAVSRSNLVTSTNAGVTLANVTPSGDASERAYREITMKAASTYDVVYSLYKFNMSYSG